VITGGAGGIGRALAERCAGEGMRLVLADLEEATLAATVAELAAQGATVVGEPADVSAVGDVEAVRDRALQEFGAVHLVCNNAGVAGGGILGAPLELWRWVIDVNLHGVVHGVHTFLPLLLEQDEGHIVNTASLAGLQGVAGLGVYCTTKFAVVGLSESLWFDLHGLGSKVGVSVLCPGFVQTQIGNSARNAPPSLHEWRESDTAAATQQMANALADAGIEPAVVAQHVLDAVRESRFYVIPHEQAAIDATESRVEWMRDGRPGKTDMSRALKP